MLLNLNNITSLTQFNQLFAQVFGQQLKGITMSYNHVSTTDISKILSHKDIVEAVEVANEINYPYFLSGVPCVEEVKEFGEELFKLNPSLKFVPHLGGRITELVNDDRNKKLVKFNRFYVYMNDCQYVLGEIGYSDYSVRGSGGNTLMVKSRKIMNAKFSEWREQQNMIMAKDVKKAVKTALKYLMPYTTRDIAEVSFSKFSSEITSASDKIRSAFYREIRVLGDSSVLGIEIKNLLKRNIEFATPQFQEFANKSEQLFADLEEESMRKITSQFVYVYDGGDKMYADVFDTVDPRNESRLVQKHIGETKTYAMEELPPDIIDKVSVLNILTDDQYVARVGMRVNSNTFWIERG
jgi:hypothetical protein